MLSIHINSLIFVASLWNLIPQLTSATSPCAAREGGCPLPTSSHGNCSNPRLFAAPDDCNCLHLHCDQLPKQAKGTACPEGWKSYTNRDGLTFCLRVFPTEVTWLRAKLSCDSTYNADLFNVRKFEKFTENDVNLSRRVLGDLETLTDRLPHWSGLHVSESKLYWDDPLPQPDRDLTATKYFGYDPASGSIVSFNSQDWVALEARRECVSFTAGASIGAGNVKLQPEYCSAGLPYICYKELAPTNDVSFYKPTNVLLCGGESGWLGNVISGGCYKYFSTIVPFIEAQQICTNSKGHLADPRNAFHQRFLTGMLTDMANGSAPLSLHVGMRGSDTSGIVSFDVGAEFAKSMLKNVSIKTLPTSTQQCGVMMNPYFVEGRSESGSVQFGDCAVSRPFICTRNLSSQISGDSGYNLNVVRNGYTLTCEISGLDNVPGEIIWKKDHQYFSRQNLSATISLTGDQYKYLISDDTDRVIGHSELAGVYVCEFWQIFPAHQYRSGGLSVTFNDTTSLRMSTRLPGIRWTSELEAFNRRVSHQDELTTEVQQVHDELLSKVETILTPLTPQTVQYGINILSLRPTADNRVEVDYRITLSGEQISEALTADTTYLQDVLNALQSSDLVGNSTATAPTSNTQTSDVSSGSIAGQFMCLESKLVHPDTLQNLTLPLRTNGALMNVMGDCRGEAMVMLTAQCYYNKKSRRSTWSTIRFKNCTVNCFSQVLTHSVSGESFSLSNTLNGQNNTFRGMCGQHEQTLFSAVCDGNKWRVTESECILMCLPSQINHPQWAKSLPTNEVAVNTSYHFEMPCNSVNKTILTASCVLNANGTDGIWTDIFKSFCIVNCSKMLVSHPTGTTWNLDTSTLGHSVQLTGLCSNQTVNLGSAFCEGSIAQGAKWNVTYISCNAQCASHTFIHPHTKEPISLTIGELNQTVTKRINCNGDSLAVQIQCQGTSAYGASWSLIDIPECSPSCTEMEWFDPITKRNFTIKSAELGNQSIVVGSCGGREQMLLRAECTGHIANGVYWEYHLINCTPSCPSNSVLHPDTGANLTFSSHSYDELATVYGTCDGKEVALLSAKCGGDITEPPVWTELKYVNCTGHCGPVDVRYIDDGDVREKYKLKSGAIGDQVDVNGTCALLPFKEISAECIGNSMDGGHWNYTVHSCFVDITCTPTHFVHPDTKTKLGVERAEPGEIVEVRGNCHGKIVVMMNVTCEARVGAAGKWVDEIYATCETDKTEQLTNLLENFKNNPLELASLTAKMSEELTNSTDEVISLMVDIVEFVASPNTTKAVDKEGEFFFDIINNMMDVNLGNDGSTTNPEAENKTGESSGSRLAKSVEGFLDSAELNKPRIRLQRANLLVEVHNTSALEDHDRSEVLAEKLTVRLPQSVTNGSKLSFVKYDNPAMFAGSKHVLGNTVFSTSVAEKTVVNTAGAINFTMNVEDNGTLPELAVCSYWDFSISDWSKEGCEMIERDNVSITCSCNHLTNFAILLDVAGQDNYIDERHHIALSVITISGLSISIVALSLHLISFVFIRKLRQNQFQKVLANLSLAILISNVIFLAGMDKTENENGCIAVAALLHYFILASFAWMFVEAFMQYRRFVKVLGTHVTHILVKAGLPAWISPAVPVAVVLIIDPQLYRGGDRFCWMKQEPLYYAFLTPIAIVIVANIVLFLLILRGLTCARPSQLRTNKSEAAMRMMYFKAGIAIFTLLGLTWIFGFLAINDARLPFQYLFCITNAFQGLVIFLLHNIRDPKVLAWWRASVLHLKPLPTGRSTSASSNTYLTKRSITSTATDSSINVESISVKAKSASVKSITPLTEKYTKLEQSKLIHSSTESDESGPTNANSASGDSKV